MKKLQATPYISSTVGFPPKAGTWDFLQLAYQEGIAASIISLIGSAYSTTSVYVLYGCVLNVGALSISAGALFFNGEVYLSPAQTGLSGPPITSNLYADLSITQYTTNADPVSFTDGSTHNVHNIRQIAWRLTGGSGNLTGDSNSTYSNMVQLPSAIAALVGIPAILTSIGTINTTLTSLQNQITTLDEDVAVGTWADMTFVDDPTSGISWANVTPYTARYRINGTGVLISEGLIQPEGTWATGIIYTFPVGARPLQDKRIVCSLFQGSSEAFYTISVSASTGVMQIKSTVSLSGVSDALSIDSLTWATV